ncbi:MAG: hypothetical protein J0L99_15170 [Chitinophagales bacterium]|nr:hypothetical protein [Chitinophagales bacterium]
MRVLMYKRRYILPFVWLWASTLFAATVGFTLHRVYCFCVGEARISWVSEVPDACEVEKVESCALTTEKSTCCSKKIQERSCCKSKAADSEHEGKCKEKQVQYFKLKTDFFYKKIGNFEDFYKISSIWAPAVLAFQNCIRPDNCTQTAAQFERPPPAAPSGRVICIRHGVFRC